MKIYGLFISLVASVLLNAQVEEFKMRQEIESYHLKPQNIGEINQRIDVIDYEKNNNIKEVYNSDFFKHNTGIYTFTEHPLTVNLMSRGWKTSQNTTSIDGVQFQSFLGDNTIFPFISTAGMQRVEVMYGDQSLLYGDQSRGSHTTFFTKNLFDLDTNAISQLKVHLKLMTNTQGANPTIQYHFLKNNISSTTLLNMSMLSGYQIGQNYNTDLASWGLNNTVERGYDTATKRFSPSAFQYENTNTMLLQASEKLSWKSSNYSEWNFYIHYGLHLNHNRFDKTSQNALIPFKVGKISQENQQIVSYLKWVKKSDDSRWFTKMQSSLSFMSSSREVFMSAKFLQLYQQKVALQTNFYKNFNARHVFFYGANIGADFYDVNAVENNNLPTQRKPYVTSNVYFKHEIRQSDDVSWLWGARMGMDYIDMFYNLPPTSTYAIAAKQFKPNATLNLTWTRHSCENSNYSINWIASIRNPQFNDYRASLIDERYLPNMGLVSEKITGLEANIYRKFDDMLEIQGSFYTTIIKDAIRPKLLPSSLMVNENIAWGGIAGAQINLKYHFTKKWMGYGNIQYLMAKDLKTSQDYDDKTPIYGTLGLKYSNKKLSSHLWAQYNGSTSYSNYHSLYQEEHAPNLTNGLYTFPSFVILNYSLNYQWTQRLHASFVVENILDQQYKPYLSSISSRGRMFLVEVGCSF